MTIVSAMVTTPGAVQQTEARWFDSARWVNWVDGLEAVTHVDPRWPEPGATVTWQSNPAGRGRVTERAVVRSPGHEQTVEVLDDSIEGHQTVEFQIVEGGTQITLSLDYRLRRRSPISPLIDRLFIRRAMTQSLQRTLGRFVAATERQDRPRSRDRAT